MALNSVYADILDGVVSRIVASNTSNPTETTTLGSSDVKLRRRATMVKGVDPLPFVTVTPEAEKINQYVMPNKAFVDYPVLVTIFREHNLVPEENNLRWTLYAREKIRLALSNTTLSGANTVFDFVSYDPQPAFDHSGIDAMHDVSAQRFTYRSQESRAS